MIPRSTGCIILKVSEHGESDKLVTFYSQDLGRVTGIAKGAKRSKQRFVNKLEEFSRLQIFYIPPRGLTGLLLITEAELLCAHLALRREFSRYVAAMYISELMLKFTRDNDPDPRLYTLLKWALVSLEIENDPQKIAALYHLQLLAIAGYRPELHQCSKCHRPVGPGPTFLFLPSNGSLLCSSCHPPQGGPNSNLLSVQTLKFLAKAQNTCLQQLNRLQPSRQTTDQTLLSLYYYTFHLLQQDIHSWQVLRSLTPHPSRNIFSSRMQVRNRLYNPPPQELLTNKQHALTCPYPNT